MMKRLLTILCIPAVLLLSSTEGWSLPLCEGNYDSSTWTNCFGTHTFPEGHKYVGEFKDDQPHGQGIETFGPKSKSAGDKYVGEWKNGKRHGYGAYTYDDGTVMKGTWVYDEFLE